MEKFIGGMILGSLIGIIMFGLIIDSQVVDRKPLIEKGIIKYLTDEKTGKTKLVWADGTPFYTEK